MWRLVKHLVGQCVFVEQEISFIGVISAKIQSVYIKGRKVSLTISNVSNVLIIIFGGIRGICHIHY